MLEDTDGCLAKQTTKILSVSTALFSDTDTSKLNTDGVMPSFKGHHPYYWGGGAAGLARHLMNEPDLKDVLEIGAVNTETNAKQQSQNRVSQCKPHFIYWSTYFYKTVVLVEVADWDGSRFLY